MLVVSVELRQWIGTKQAQLVKIEARGKPRPVTGETQMAVCCARGLNSGNAGLLCSRKAAIKGSGCAQANACGWCGHKLKVPTAVSQDRICAGKHLGVVWTWAGARGAKCLRVLLWCRQERVPDSRTVEGIRAHNLLTGGYLQRSRVVKWRERALK